MTGLPENWFGTASVPHLAVAVGKDGYVYLLNRDNLGGIGEGPGEGDKVVQRIGPNGGVWSRPGVWPGQGGWVYIPTASNGKSAGGGSGKLDVYKYGVSGGGPADALAGGRIGGRLRVRLGRARHHLLRHHRRARRSSGPSGCRTATAKARSCARTTRCRSAASRRCASALRSAPRPSSAPRAWAPGRLYVGTRDGHVLGFGSPGQTAPQRRRRRIPGDHARLELGKDAHADGQRRSSKSQHPQQRAQRVRSPLAAAPGPAEHGPEAVDPDPLQAREHRPARGDPDRDHQHRRQSPVLALGYGTDRCRQTRSFTRPSSASAAPPSTAPSRARRRSPTWAPARWKCSTPPAPSAPFHVEAASMPEPSSHLGPGQSITIPVSFEPGQVGSYAGTHRSCRRPRAPHRCS